jgi:hypothetical protein
MKIHSMERQDKVMKGHAWKGMTWEVKDINGKARKGM